MQRQTDAPDATGCQANQRILDSAAKKMGVDGGKVLSNIARYGNTSAASIPLALDEAVRAGQVRPAAHPLSLLPWSEYTAGRSLTRYSVPSARASCAQVQAGDVVATSGFGAGLTWAAAIFRWGDPDAGAGPDGGA